MAGEDPTGSVRVRWTRRSLGVSSRVGYSGGLGLPFQVQALEEDRLATRVDDEARLVFLVGDGLGHAAGRVTRLEEEVVTIRCLAPSGVRAGTAGVVMVETEAGLRRARAMVSARDDLTVRLTLREPLQPPCRRRFERLKILADVWFAPVAGQGTVLAPERITWLEGIVELSPDAVRALIPIPVAHGDRVDVWLRVPARTGVPLRVPGAVLRVDHGADAGVTVCFTDTEPLSVERLAEVIDDLRLEQVVSGRLPTE